MGHNLNRLAIPTKNHHQTPLYDHSTNSQDGTVAVYFRDLEDRLVAFIERAPIVVGCVAWLTSEAILTAMANCEAVSIIVQKEDFLRPDLDSHGEWKTRLRRLYDALPGGLDRLLDMEGTRLQNTYDILTDGRENPIAAVRCVGNYNRLKEPAFPRSHHKFVVFCEYQDRPSLRIGSLGDPVHVRELVPYAVWTGSFNFTKNAGHSLENALVLRDPNIVNAYLNEYAQIAALSEPLDWEWDYVAPEWRLGT